MKKYNVVEEKGKGGGEERERGVRGGEKGDGRMNFFFFSLSQNK